MPEPQTRLAAKLPSALLDPTDPKSQRAQLAHLATVTHLLHVRNLNQHRRSHWWRHFSVFRKQLNHACDELCVQVPFRASLPGDKPAAQTDKLNKRIEWWVEANMAHKWHDAFSHLVATTQYSNLGLVLLAILGRATHILGVIVRMAARASAKQAAPVSMSRPDKSILQGDSGIERSLQSGTDKQDEAQQEAQREAKRQKEMARVLRKFEREALCDNLFDVSLPQRSDADKQLKGKKRATVAPQRDSSDEDKDLLGVFDEQGQDTKKRKPSSASAPDDRLFKKKKKKKRDAIDDLFAGL